MNGEKKWSNSNVHTITKLQINTLVIIIKNIKKYKEKKIIIKNRPISILLSRVSCIKYIPYVEKKNLQFLLSILKNLPSRYVILSL